MTRAYDVLDVTLARDVVARKFSWFILPGRSIAFVRFDSSYVPQAWMPPKPIGKSPEDRSPKPSAFWHPRGVAMLRPTLDQHLQMYFRRVQRMTPRTCHPSTIHHEARLIVHSVGAGLGQPKSLCDPVAKALFRAGTARLEYTRTVAFLIHDALVQLSLSDWCAMRTLQIHLEDMATSSILKAWSNLSVDTLPMPRATGLEESAHPIKPTLDEMFNAAALYGDLVAVGVIPCNLLSSIINGFLDCLASVSQCRVLYLLLVRATFHLASPIRSDCLLGWRSRLLSPRLIKLPMDDEMVQRWIIELCNVIDKAVAQNQAILQVPENTHPPGATHIWDTKLTGQVLHDLLEKAGETCK